MRQSASFYEMKSRNILKLIGFFSTESVSFNYGSNLWPWFVPRPIIWFALNLVVSFLMLWVLPIIIDRGWLDPRFSCILCPINQTFHCISLCLSVWHSRYVPFGSAISQVSDRFFLRMTPLHWVEIFLMVFLLNSVLLVLIQSFYGIWVLNLVPWKNRHLSNIFIN